MSLPSSASLRAAVEAMDKPVFSLDGPVHFMDALLDGNDGETLPAALSDEDFPALPEGGMTPAQTSARAEFIDFVTPVTGFVRTAGVKTKDRTAPGAKAMTPITAARAGSLDLFANETLVEVDVENGTPVTHAHYSPADNEAPPPHRRGRRVSVIASATRRHLSLWATQSPAHRKRRVGDENAPPGDVKKTKVEKVEGKAGGGQAVAARPPVENDWTGHAVQGGEISIPDACVEAPRAPRIFRFRVGASEIAPQVTQPGGGVGASAGASTDTQTVKR